MHFNEHGMPVSDVFDDIYFSNANGLAESEYVFIRHNNLSNRFANWPTTKPFVIAETGFGTGLNFLLACCNFLQQAPSDARLHFVSFERYPLSVSDLKRALAHWPQLQPLSDQLIQSYPALIPGCHRLTLEGHRITLDLWFADVLEALPDWQQANPRSVHAWFLDGFAPAKNPQMWQPELYQAMAGSAASDCTLATFTAVGAVRRGLREAGFVMRKVAGFGTKREMLTGTRTTPGMPSARAKRKIAIVGGGIAAATLAKRLTSEACEVDVFCADPELAGGASGNPQGAVYPLLQADYTPATAIYSQAFLSASEFYQKHCPDFFYPCGVLQLAFNENQQKRQESALARTSYPETFVTALSAVRASQLAGIDVTCPAVYFPKAGWLKPAQTVRSLFAQSKCRLHLNQYIESVSRMSSGWVVHTGQASRVFDDVVFANGPALAEQDKFLNGPEGVLDIRPVRGQVTQVKTTDALKAVQTVICHKGYITPQHENTHCVGATFDKHRSDNTLLENDDIHNIKLLHAHLPSASRSLTIAGHRASVRATTADHLPLVGPMPRLIEHNVSHWPGLWILGGLGSRGFTSAPWCAEVLTGQMFGRVLPTGKKLSLALAPARFIERKLAREKS